MMLLTEYPNDAGTCICLQSAGKGSPPENTKQGQLPWLCFNGANDVEMLLKVKAIYHLETLQSFSQGFSCRGSTLSQLQHQTYGHVPQDIVAHGGLKGR